MLMVTASEAFDRKLSADEIAEVRALIMNITQPYSTLHFSQTIPDRVTGEGKIVRLLKEDKVWEEKDKMQHGQPEVVNGKEHLSDSRWLYRKYFEHVEGKDEFEKHAILRRLCTSTHGDDPVIKATSLHLQSIAKEEAALTR